MDTMPVTLTWPEVALRLGCTVVAGLLLGYNRSEHGKAAGLRTTLLVCLAAAVAMLQMNFLLPLSGRSPDSFIMNDLMRLPLGILTGVGFIGAGAILRRETLVIGVTTAATLWYATVIGLCFGGGQIGLGAAATVLGLAGLWGLKWIEDRIRQQRSARLRLELGTDGPSEQAICDRLRAAGFKIVGRVVTWDGERQHWAVSFDLREMTYPAAIAMPDLVQELIREPGVEKVHWQVPD